MAITYTKAQYYIIKKNRKYFEAKSGEITIHKILINDISKDFKIGNKIESFGILLDIKKKDYANDVYFIPITEEHFEEYKLKDYRMDQTYLDFRTGNIENKEYIVTSINKKWIKVIGKCDGISNTIFNADCFNLLKINDIIHQPMKQIDGRLFPIRY